MMLVSFFAVEKLYDIVGNAICCRYCSRKWRKPDSDMTDQRNVDFLAEHWQSHQASTSTLDLDEVPF